MDFIKDWLNTKKIFVTLDENKRKKVNRDFFALSPMERAMVEEAEKDLQFMREGKEEH